MVYRGGQIINIAGTTPVDDPEYRYKMPAVFGKIEGSGNGIKTVLPNISDVALSLHRQPGEVNKFFGTELGAQSRYSADTDRAIVNGAHTDATLQELMHRYIEKFVLCPNCRLPESEYKIKNDIIWHRCAACGAKGTSRLLRLPIFCSTFFFCVHIHHTYRYLTLYLCCIQKWLT